MKTLQRQKTLTELATEKLRDDIIKNRYMFGEALSEKLLSELLGTSKTPIREALARLKTEGLVNIFPQKGTFVFMPSLKEIKDLVELRFILESAALRRAYSRNRAPLLKSLEETLIKSMDALRINNSAEYARLDSDFHEMIFDFCDNEYLFGAYTNVSTKFAALRTRVLYQQNLLDTTHAEHEDIYSFLKTGKIQEAITTLDKHLSSFEIYYKNYTTDQLPQESSKGTKAFAQLE